MPAQKSAIITGASSGIGLAIAHLLGELGHGLTLAARRPEKLATAADELRAAGYDVEHHAASLDDEDAVRTVASAHRDRFGGRLDVLVNNAGVGFGAPVAEITTKRLDMMLDLNVRAIVLFYRECVPMLRATAAEHGGAQVINTASIAGTSGQPWLSVYSATKAAVINFTEAMHKELVADGIKNTALCPAFVDTPMTDFAKSHGVAAEAMITPRDIAESVRFLLALSPACIVPEIRFIRPEQDGAL